MDENGVTVVDLRDAPVTMDPEMMGSHDSVLAALAQHYELQGQKTHQLWVGDLDDKLTTMFDLALPDSHLLFDVETVDTLIGLAPHRYEEWRAAGYEVWIVAPNDKLDVVKRRMHGNVDRVQGWRMSGPKVIFEQPVPG